MATPHIDAIALDFMVRRDNLHQCKFVAAAASDAITLQPGQVLLQIYLEMLEGRARPDHGNILSLSE